MSKTCDYCKKNLENTQEYLKIMFKDEIIGYICIKCEDKRD